MAYNRSLIKIIPLDDLQEGMEINAYSRFNHNYRSIDEKTCQWLKLNFKGVTADVIRNKEPLTIAVNQLQPKDQLEKLFCFPDRLKKLTRVNSRLIEELARRGFLEFQVKERSKGETAKQRKHAEAVKSAEELVHKVTRNVKVREQASKSVRSLINNARSGMVDISNISRFVDHIVQDNSSQAIGVISGLKKSDQTYAHCVDVGAIFHVVYNKFLQLHGKSMPLKDQQLLLLGAVLHDIGKSKIPREILDSQKRFERDSHEMKLMETHPEHGAKILTDLKMPDKIINMALYHHLKEDPELLSSYPKGVRGKKAKIETRILTFVDVYQALVGYRSYKKSWPPPKAIQYIDQLAGIEFDLDLWKEFQKIMGSYPTGSLLELSDGSLAFVVGAHEKSADHPKVAIVKNGRGEKLSHNTLIDLKEEQDISIRKGLDHYDVFGDTSLKVFASLKIS